MTDRSPYLAEALAAMQAQQPQSAGGVAANLGGQALLRFAQNRKQRQVADALSPSYQDPVVQQILGADPTQHQGLISQLGGLARLGQMWKF